MIQKLKAKTKTNPSCNEFAKEAERLRTSVQGFVEKVTLCSALADACTEVEDTEQQLLETEVLNDQSDAHLNGAKQAKKRFDGLLA